MQFRGKLGPRRAGPDDGDMKLTGPERPLLCLRAQAGIDQAAIETRRLGGRFERHRVLCDARSSEIVGDTADRDYQEVVTHGPLGGDLSSLVIEGGGEMDLLARAIE